MTKRTFKIDTWLQLGAKPYSILARLLRYVVFSSPQQNVGKPRPGFFEKTHFALQASITANAESLAGFRATFALPKDGTVFNSGMLQYSFDCVKRIYASKEKHIRHVASILLGIRYITIIQLYITFVNYNPLDEGYRVANQNYWNLLRSESF